MATAAMPPYDEAMQAKGPDAMALAMEFPGDTATSSDAQQILACCVGTACACNESCMEVFSRSIHADDDSHIRNQTHIEDSSIDRDEKCCNRDDCHSVNTEDRGDHAPAASCEHTSAENEIHICKEKSSKSSKPPVSACSKQKSIGLMRSRETLVSFGCICRAMLARGLDSCCMTRHSMRRSNPSSESRLSLLQKVARRSSYDSHRSCGSHRSRSIRSHASLRNVSTNASRQSVNSCGNSCCDEEVSIQSVRRDADSCERISHPSLDSCCGRSSCGNSKEIQSCHRGGDCCDKRSCSSSSVCKDFCCGANDGGADIEKQVSGLQCEPDSSSLHHATLAVKGMTCTGCEKKLIRVLRDIPTVSRIKTSLVLARVEFDCSGTEDLRSLFRTIEQRTGFSVKEVAPSSSHSLDLIVDPAQVDRFCSTTSPDGVDEVVRVNKNTVRIFHDPTIIGARDIMAVYASYVPKLAPIPRDPALTAGLKHLRYLALRTLVSAVLTVPVLIMTWAPLPDRPKAYGIACLILATIVQTAIAGPFYVNALKSLFFSRIIESDLLIVLSTTTAYIYSVVAFAFEMLGRPLHTGEFFETSTLLVTLITVGQLVSAFARHRAIEAISLRSLQRNTAVLVSEGGIEEVTDGRLLQYGDTFKVFPDTPIITDGTVVRGQSEVDESMMTGEALPVHKQLGSTVIAGTSNGSGILHVKVTRLPGDNTITDIANMVDDARISRARVQDVADVVCGWFVPVVLVMAIITFVTWIIVGVKLRSQSAGEAAVTALTYAIALLAVSCPCAIGLAVPMVILIASGVAAKRGLIFKSATTIENAKKIDHVVFDKTGTLTKGQLSVVESDILDSSDSEVPSAILGLVVTSKHPVARAVAEKLRAEGVNPSNDVSGVEVVVGKGITGTWKGQSISGGSARWLELENNPQVQRLLNQGLTTFGVIHGTETLAMFGLVDTLRPESHLVVSNLRGRGIDISILSGDHLASVNRIASELGIPQENVRAACLPADKQSYIREIAKGGKQVLFCGDGTNDAIALAQADIGVHMYEEAGSGAGIAASSAADVVLIRPTLTGILTLLELSEAVNKRIMLNFIWSAVYNLVAVLFAAGAFVNARIAPAYAGLGEIVSVVPVVLVALQLKWFKGK